MLNLILITFAITLPISLLWVYGIDKMDPNDKGKDFLDENF